MELQYFPVMSPFFSPVDSPATIPTISRKPTDESERTGQRARGHESHWPRGIMSSSHYEPAASPVRRAHNGEILYLETNTEKLAVLLRVRKC